jgi:hypothetical protein
MRRRMTAEEEAAEGEAAEEEAAAAAAAAAAYPVVDHVSSQSLGWLRAVHTRSFRPDLVLFPETGNQNFRPVRPVLGAGKNGGNLLPFPETGKPKPEIWFRKWL